jgi:hypothetical protein
MMIDFCAACRQPYLRVGNGSGREGFCSAHCRFWAKVDTSGGEDACWNWTASASHDFGYGEFMLDGTKRRAHRWTYEQKVGPIPAGMYVLHKCDNPKCVNPKHLFLGTHQDNCDDMRRKGRHFVPPPWTGQKRGAEFSANLSVKLKESWARRKQAASDAAKQDGGS